MAYATLQDLQDRFGTAELQRFAWDSELGQPDSAQVGRALEQASSTIDLYIGQAARLPLDSPPAILAALCCDIARYLLQDTSPLDEAEARHKAALTMLRDIADGRATLPLASDAPATGPTVSVKRTGDDRTFTRETLAGF